MSISALIRAMSAAGAPPEAIALAVEAVEAKDAEIAAHEKAQADKRAAHAEWKRNRRADIASMDSPRTDDGQSTSDPALDKSPQTPKINPTPGVGVGAAPARKGNFPCPEGCEPDDWRDLLANRKSKRMGMTPSIYRKLLRDLAAQSDDDWPPGRVLRHAAERGWAAIFDPRASQGNPSNGRHQPNLRPGDSSLRGQRPDPSLDLLRAAQAAQRVPDVSRDHREAGSALPAIWAG